MHTKKEKSYERYLVNNSKNNHSTAYIKKHQKSVALSCIKLLSFSSFLDGKFSYPHAGGIFNRKKNMLAKAGSGR